jgi:hypothetical protein
MRPTLAPWLFAAVLSLAACQTPAPSYTVASTYATPSKESVEGLSKVFSIESDMRGHGWVLRRGTKIVFHSDGRAELDTTAYAVEGLPLPNALHLEIIQSGPDGNILFSLPGTDVGQPIHFRYPRMDYPVHLNFGYNRAHFARIKSVKVAARLLKEPGPDLIPSSSGKQ